MIIQYVKERINTTTIQTHTHNIQYSLHFHCNSGDANPPQCYVMHTLPVLSIIFLSHNLRTGRGF